MQFPFVGVLGFIRYIMYRYCYVNSGVRSVVISLKLITRLFGVVVAKSLLPAPQPGRQAGDVFKVTVKLLLNSSR